MSTPAEVSSVMKEIEDKTAAKLAEMTKSGAIADPFKVMQRQESKETMNKSITNLQNLMGEGAKEFERKVGRPMTYSEMRAMYG